VPNSPGGHSPASRAFGGGREAETAAAEAAKQAEWLRQLRWHCIETTFKTVSRHSAADAVAVVAAAAACRC